MPTVACFLPPHVCYARLPCYCIFSAILRQEVQETGAILDVFEPPNLHGGEFKSAYSFLAQSLLEQSDTSCTTDSTDSCHIGSCSIWLSHGARSRTRRRFAAPVARRVSYSVVDPRPAVYSGREGTPSSVQGTASNNKLTVHSDGCSASDGTCSSADDSEGNTSVDSLSILGRALACRQRRRWVAATNASSLWHGEFPLENGSLTPAMASFPAEADGDALVGLDLR